MVRRVLRRILAGIALAAVVLGAPGLMAQSSPAQRQTPAADPSAALLAEVRALRAEIAEVSRISLRSQLLVARVQLQAEKTREVRARLSGMEEALEEMRSGRSTVPAAQADDLRREIASQLGGLRTELHAAQTQEQALRAEEADITSGLAAEQGRWNDFNSRLDELERALPSR